MINFDHIFGESAGFTIPMMFPKILITPEIATGMLKHNNFNRRIKDSSKRDYIDDMRNGNWIYNGDNIRFDKNGNLIDGQHKLEAIVGSGTSQYFNVETGLPVEAFKTIDTGRNRTSSDIAHLYHIKHSNVSGAAITFITNFRKDNLVEKKGKVRNYLIADFITNPNEDVPMLEQCATLASEYTKTLRNIRASTLAGLLYLMRKVDADKPIVFFDRLSNIVGNYVDKDDYIYLLYQRIFKDPNIQRKMLISERIALIIKAYSYWLKGRKGKLLKWNNKEEFPKIPGT
jgi:hypothetical protein